MHCKHLLRYSRSTQIWSVASCCAKNTPYVPSLNELEKFCQCGKHIVCPAYLFSCEMGKREAESYMPAGISGQRCLQKSA